MDRVIVDAREHIGEPSLWINIIELRRHDQRCHDGGAVGTALGPGEQPGFAAERKAAQRAFSRIVGQTDPTILDEASEPIPAAQHIIDRFRDRGCARQARALFA